MPACRIVTPRVPTSNVEHAEPSPLCTYSSATCVATGGDEDFPLSPVSTTGGKARAMVKDCAGRQEPHHSIYQRNLRSADLERTAKAAACRLKYYEAPSSPESAADRPSRPPPLLSQHTLAAILGAGRASPSAAFRVMYAPLSGRGLTPPLSWRRKFGCASSCAVSSGRRGCRRASRRAGRCGACPRVPLYAHKEK